MPHVRFCGCTVNFQRTVFVDRREITLPFFVAHIHNSMAGEKHGVAAISGRHHTIKHINSVTDPSDNVGRRAHTHQITRFFMRKYVTDLFGDFIHGFGRLTHAQTSDGITGTVELTDEFCRLFTQIFIHAPLHYRKKALFVAVERLCLMKMIIASLEPLMCQLHAFLGIFPVGRIRSAFIKGHHDVGADYALHVHHVLRCELVPATINMRLKNHSLIGNFSDLGKRIHLISTTVGQYGPVPTVESVQTTGLLQNPGTGSEIQVIGVAQNDLRFDVVAQLIESDTFHRTDCPHRHEYRSENIAVIGGQNARARFSAFV
ncbi:hypothetical protein SDC9_147380 [bioreactor metagenome]|uniref:Uncharacterized protein n=1 Tax=bioreactor metagenome TaxID=1076179 RepID=A0A645EFK1_9ZZZZ